MKDILFSILGLLIVVVFIFVISHSVEPETYPEQAEIDDYYQTYVR